MSAAKRAPLKQAQSITSLLRELLSKPGVGEQITRHQAWLVWDKLVGKQIAARARPLRLRQGVLEVQVDHPVWMQQLQMLKPQILAKMTAQIPEAGITDIYLRKAHHPGVSIKPAAPPSRVPDWQNISLTAAEQAQIDAQLSALTDPQLQQDLRRLFSKQLKLRKSRAR